MIDKQIPCPVCQGSCSPLDVVDFNKSCEEIRSKYFPLAGIPIYYFLCRYCNFCFAPEFSNWQYEDFEKKIYNSEYVLVDPDYLKIRPSANADTLIKMFGNKGQGIRHLDYGGGKGLLSTILRNSGWQSASYDPFVDRNINLRDLGQYDLITAYEVFEHVSDVRQLISSLSSLLVQDGLVLFSTLVSDGNIGFQKRITWWYASPRNGHISLFSAKSLSILGDMERFKFSSFSSVFHLYWRSIPQWANHVFKVG